MKATPKADECIRMLKMIENIDQFFPIKTSKEKIVKEPELAIKYFGDIERYIDMITAIRTYRLFPSRPYHIKDKGFKNITNDAKEQFVSFVEKTSSLPGNLVYGVINKYEEVTLDDLKNEFMEWLPSPNEETIKQCYDIMIEKYKDVGKLPDPNYYNYNRMKNDLEFMDFFNNLIQCNLVTSDEVDCLLHEIDKTVLSFEPLMRSINDIYKQFLKSDESLSQSVHEQPQRKEQASMSLQHYLNINKARFKLTLEQIKEIYELFDKLQLCQEDCVTTEDILHTFQKSKIKLSDNDPDPSVWIHYQKPMYEYLRDEYKHKGIAKTIPFVYAFRWLVQSYNRQCFIRKNGKPFQIHEMDYQIGDICTDPYDIEAIIEAKKAQKHELKKKNRNNNTPSTVDKATKYDKEDNKSEDKKSQDIAKTQPSKRLINEAQLKECFTLNFKGGGNSKTKIDYFSEYLMPDLNIDRSDKEFAKIALSIHQGEKLIPTQKSIPFSKWYQTFCNLVGCGYHKEYKPNKLILDDEFKRKFNYL
jgi:hypothetical protein